MNKNTDDALSVARWICFADHKVVSQIEVWNPFVIQIKTGLTAEQIKIQTAAWAAPSDMHLRISTEKVL